MGKPGDIPETRERLVLRYPYRIVYHIHAANQVIEVWRVVHSAQEWPPRP
jgi:plasmid stabilization system protein ParE